MWIIDLLCCQMVFESHSNFILQDPNLTCVLARKAAKKTRVKMPPPVLSALLADDRLIWTALTPPPREKEGEPKRFLSGNDGSAINLTV